MDRNNLIYLKNIGLTPPNMLFFFFFFYKPWDPHGYLLGMFKISRNGWRAAVGGVAWHQRAAEDGANGATHQSLSEEGRVETWNSLEGWV